MTQPPHRPPAPAGPIVFGWEEWLALPELGLPAIRAKVDTGAKTSALHAFGIEPFGPIDHPRIRFGVHPIPGRADVSVICTAEVVDRRAVTSSNGEAELRFVISTPLVFGGLTVDAEVSLSNRESMNYRMLIGRQALEAAGAVVRRATMTCWTDGTNNRNPGVNSDRPGDSMWQNGLERTL